MVHDSILHQQLWKPKKKMHTYYRKQGKGKIQESKMTTRCQPYWVETHLSGGAMNIKMEKVSRIENAEWCKARKIDARRIAYIEETDTMKYHPGPLVCKHVDARHVTLGPKDLSKLLQVASKHTSIVPVFNFFVSVATADMPSMPEEYVFVTPFYNGGDLDAHLESINNHRHLRTPTLTQKMGVISGLWSAINYLAKKDMAHGDIKNANILVRHSADYADYEAALSDLDTLTMCPPEYAAPQTPCWATAMIFNSWCDPRRDQVALALVTCDFLINTEDRSSRSWWCSGSNFLRLGRDVRNRLAGNPLRGDVLHPDDLAAWYAMYSTHVKTQLGALGAADKKIVALLSSDPTTWKKKDGPVPTGMIQWLQQGDHGRTNRV